MLFINRAKGIGFLFSPELLALSALAPLPFVLTLLRLVLLLTRFSSLVSCSSLSAAYGRGEFDWLWVDGEEGMEGMGILSPEK